MPQLQPLTLVAPGKFGLNKEEEFTLLGPEWATKALNMVFDRSGRLAARKGWVQQTVTTQAATAIQRIHEYVKQDGTVETISATATKIHKGITDLGNVSNDITSSTAPTAGYWKFQNFNNKCVAFQESHTAIVYTGTGDFADITASSGTLPDGGAACAAFGRLWVSDSNNQVVKYCALLDETDWGGTDTGSLDLSSIWTNGTDEIVAIEAFGANLVVFGKRHIIIWTSSGGTELGLIPTEMYVADTIEGTGCVARDSVQLIGEGDVLYLSPTGVQSLTRTISQKNNPVATLTKKAKSYIEAFISGESSQTNIDSLYSPTDGFYLLMFPSSNRTIVLDVRRQMPDEQGDMVMPITEWLHTTALSCGTCLLAGDVLFGIDVDIGKYSGNSDNNVGYFVEWQSPYLNLGPDVENRLKMLKEIRSLVLISGSPTVLWKWNFDFGLEGVNSASYAYSAGSGAEFNIAKFNIDEYAGGIEVFQSRVAGNNEGQYIQVGMATTITNMQLVLQQLTLFAKLGRMN